MAGQMFLRCKNTECGARILRSHYGKTVYPLEDTRILSVTTHATRRSVTAECGACFAVATWDAERKHKPTQFERRARRIQTDILPGLSYPSTDNIVELMQDRWETFRKERLRERGTVASGLRFDVFVRDDFRCRYCGASAEDGAILHADHVIPQSKGGPTTLENLATACMDCNLGKSNKLLPVDRYHSV